MASHEVAPSEQIDLCRDCVLNSSDQPSARISRLKEGLGASAAIYDGDSKVAEINYHERRAYSNPEAIALASVRRAVNACRAGSPYKNPELCEAFLVPRGGTADFDDL